MTELPRLQTGDAAPDFKLVNQADKPVSLADLKGKKAIVYFYPAASTPGCTKEACDFNDNLGDLQKAGYAVVGVSPDAPAKLQKFASTEHLNFDLLSDPELVAHKAYGAYGTKSMYGREFTGVLRSTFVLDETGKVTLALYNVKATGHVAMLRKQLGL
jgi:peroxiredoxin Q/BCP